MGSGDGFGMDLLIKDLISSPDFFNTRPGDIWFY